MTDRFYVVRAQAGDHTAYTALVAAYRQMVYGVCYRVAGNADDADDLAHEAFVEAFLKLDQLRNPDSFGPWLRTLALNLCRMWLRGRKLEAEELTKAIPAGQPPERDLLHAIRRGLTRLTALLARFWKAADAPDHAVNVPVLAALARMGTRFADALLVAAVALGDIGGEEARDALQASMRSDDKALARTAAKVLHTSPHFRAQVQPNVALQQMDREVRERLVGADTHPCAFMSLHEAIGVLPEIRPYNERELTRYIARACHDYSATRRQLIMEGLMRRNAGVYELTDIGQAVWRVEHFIRAHYLR